MCCCVELLLWDGGVRDQSPCQTKESLYLVAFTTEIFPSKKLSSGIVDTGSMLHSSHSVCGHAHDTYILRCMILEVKATLNQLNETVTNVATILFT